MSKKKIIYVNFAPYENAGEILTFLLDHFDTVLLFAFTFHKLGKNQKPSTLYVYKRKRVVKTYRLFQTPTSPELAFILLPIRSIIILLQILFHSVRLNKQYGPFDFYFTVNAFTSWTGNILRAWKVVHRTVFWVWDYYPPIHKNKVIMFMRALYWLFDRPATIAADHTVFLNHRLETLRKSIGALPRSRTYLSVPIGTDPDFSRIKNPKKALHVAFLGVLKKSQGLELFFESIPYLSKTLPPIVLHIIGGGPEFSYFQMLAKQTGVHVVFHGYIPNDKRVNTILKNCHIGIAPYVPDESNVSYYSDPSKIKRYLSVGIPVITTNVFDFASVIEKKHAGIVTSYSPKLFARALEEILKKYPRYQKQAKHLARAYDYRKLYPKLFTFGGKHE